METSAVNSESIASRRILTKLRYRWPRTAMRCWSCNWHLTLLDLMSLKEHWQTRQLPRLSMKQEHKFREIMTSWIVSPGFHYWNDHQPDAYYPFCYIYTYTSCQSKKVSFEVIRFVEFCRTLSATMQCWPWSVSFGGSFNLWLIVTQAEKNPKFIKFPCNSPDCTFAHESNTVWYLTFMRKFAIVSTNFRYFLAPKFHAFLTKMWRNPTAAGISCHFHCLLLASQNSVDEYRLSTSSHCQIVQNNLKLL